MTDRRQPAPPWTNAETNRARELLEAKADDATFLRELGRTKGSAYSRIKYVSDPAAYRAERQLKRDGLRRAKNVGRFYIPDDVMRDALARRLADRDLTSILCGDPAPGQSALDRRQAAGVQL